MPTYDYVCEGCEHTFEEFQGINEEHLSKCPECGEPRLVRQIGTGGAVLFKGSGFYTTDYRSDSYNSAKSADEKAPGKSETPPKKDTPGSGKTGNGNGD